MKVCLLIIFIAIQAIICEKAVSKLRKKLIVPKMNDQCKKIKCATIDKPLCVRMRRNDLSLTMHIMAANMCELDYMKCHDDVEAKIVPMKYCGHNAELDVAKKNKMGKHIRVKRKVHSINKVVRNKKKLRSDQEETTKLFKMPFGQKPHPIKDPWSPEMWNKIPPELYMYLVM